MRRTRETEPLLLAADIGNTHVTLGAFAGRRLLRVWRLDSDPRMSARGFGARIRDLTRRAFSGRRPTALVFGSVVPALGRVFRRLGPILGMSVLEIDARSPMGLRVPPDIRRGVGVDRLLNALAAWRSYGGAATPSAGGRRGRPRAAVIVDVGTATTVDCVSGEGEFLGGAILPGPKTAARALSEFTARLPEVRVRRPRRPIGRSTTECLRSGLFFGQAGMVDRVIEEILGQLRSEGRGRAVVLLTGGWSGAFLHVLSRRVVWAPDLTLTGLRLAFQSVRGGPARRVMDRRR